VTKSDHAFDFVHQAAAGLVAEVQDFRNLAEFVHARKYTSTFHLFFLDCWDGRLGKNPGSPDVMVLRLLEKEHSSSNLRFDRKEEDRRGNRESYRLGFHSHEHDI
jgi:hypothetical protein